MPDLSKILLNYSCLLVVLLKGCVHTIDEEDWNELTYVLLTMKCIYKKLSHYVHSKPCLTTPLADEKVKAVSEAKMMYKNRGE